MGYDVSDSKVISGQTMTHLKALKESRDFQIIGVVDSDQLKSKVAEQCFSVETSKSPTEISVFSPPTLLTVATPTYSHRKVIEELPTGLIPKILLIEKPVGDSLKDSIYIRDWAAKNSVIVFVNYFRRYLPHVIDARNYLQRLNLGELISIEIDCYGEILNIFSHFMDLGMFLTGNLLFCDCKKKFVENSNLTSIIKCLECNVVYSFFGLGLKRKTCNAIFRFSNFQIAVHQDGMNIKITTSKGVAISSYQTPLTVYKNYQAFVYSKIANFSIDSEFLTGLEQSIQIHTFTQRMGG